MRSGILIPVLVAGFGVHEAFGWGAAGHEIVATIAQMYLHPTTLSSLCDILDFTSPNPTEQQCHLAPIASWADRIKYRNRWSSAMHYVGAVDDYSRETCAFPGAGGWAGQPGINVLGAMRNDTGILENWVRGVNTDENLANEALKFLVHFVGDMHQPLHLTGRDRGGNSDKVLFDGRQTNLHSLWDGLLIAKAIRTTPSNYTRPLAMPQVEHNLRGAIYDPYIRRIVWEGLLGQWKEEVATWLECPTVSESSGVFPFGNVLQKFWNFIFPKSVETDDGDIFCPYHWTRPIHSLNCEIVWPKELDEPPYKHHRYNVDESSLGATKYVELDTPRYAGAIADEMLVEKLLAQGGIRLAGVLNWLFADVDGDKLSLYHV